MAELTWTETAPGVWKAVIGFPDGLTPLSLIGAAPRTEALAQMVPARLPFGLDLVSVTEAGGGRLMLALPLEDEEKLYGTGLQFMRMNQRGRTRYLRVNSDPKQDTGETHAPVPFYVSDRGYGVLIDTARAVTMHLGSTMRLAETRKEDALDRNRDSGWRATLRSERAEIRIPEEGAGIYLFGGPALGDAVRRYNLFCGGGALPPKWGLGFWHRVPAMYSAEEAIAEAREYRKRDFPCDVIGLEPGWHSRSYPVTYEWDAERFPDPKRFVDEMTDDGFRVNLWEHPYVSPESPIYDSLKPLSGDYTVWGGLAPDYSLNAAREIYERQHSAQHIGIGVSGYKLDECDGSELTNNAWMFPAHASFPSGLDGERMRQLYGLMFQKMTTDLFRSGNRRTYGLARASNAAASSLPCVLYSDLYDHKQFIRALCNSSFSGLLWSPEVRRARSAEDWVRRMQTVCFSPLAMLNAWGDGTKPWSFPEAAPIIRHYIKLRMRLQPYLYTAFARYREEGIPPFRAMPFAISPDEFASAEKRRLSLPALNTTDGAYGKRSEPQWDDQYMIGDAMLVAPLVEGEVEREVLLPAGSWIGLESGERYEGGGVIRVRAGIDTIPVFVRDGAVIPMTAALPHALRPGEQAPLELVHFGTKEGEGWVYDDDGETLDYERGACGWWKAAVRKTAEGGYEGEFTGPGGLPASYSGVKWRFAELGLNDDGDE
ncbi:glycoside hydrolase family 31 protein [Paenibacillus arenilitoris]|uniref:ABC transporter substrate-binding protein n=1 Tax=Paenibacillus arenilitoris TaxID=2772299 RepID=A0A927CU87_9BACL|nr:TIM-barrel domain-containing protein [Paenibacillus arenilitoris]MBD2871961.1 ABC transporter substrate-binding protein [Paenibacillus arenilitoris]